MKPIEYGLATGFYGGIAPDIYSATSKELEVWFRNVIGFGDITKVPGIPMQNLMLSAELFKFKAPYRYLPLVLNSNSKYAFIRLSSETKELTLVEFEIEYKVNLHREHKNWILSKKKLFNTELDLLPLLGIKEHRFRHGVMSINGVKKVYRLGYDDLNRNQFVLQVTISPVIESVKGGDLRTRVYSYKESGN